MATELYSEAVAQYPIAVAYSPLALTQTHLEINPVVTISHHV